MNFDTLHDPQDDDTRSWFATTTDGFYGTAAAQRSFWAIFPTGERCWVIEYNLFNSSEFFDSYWELTHELDHLV